LIVKDLYHVAALADGAAVKCLLTYIGAKNKRKINEGGMVLFISEAAAEQIPQRKGSTSE